MRIARLTIGSYRGQRGRDLAAPRRRRHSRRQVLLGSALAVLAIALLAGGGYWLLTASLFAVARVESGPYRYSSESAVTEAFDRILGHNIWALRGARVEEACAGLPWVRDIHVRRRLPDTVVVEFVEWQPLLEVAVASGPDATRMLVADGRVLDAPAHLDAPGLPLLLGCAATADADGRLRLRAADLPAVLDLVRALQETGLEAACPVDFVRRTGEGYVLELQGRAGSLQLGHEDFSRRLNRYLLTREQIPAGASVDLRFEDRITIDSPEPERT